MFSEPQTPGIFLEDSFSETKPFTPILRSPSTSETSIIQAKLNRRLGPEYVSQRPAPGGGPKLTYIEGWKIIGLANEVFGYNGWSSTVTSLETDFVDMDPESRRWNVGVTAIVKITLKDGTYHEDIGYGTGENLRSKGTALDKVGYHFGCLTVMTVATGEEGSCNRRSETRSSQFWESSWPLSVREIIYAGGSKD
jgi:DNA repair and recombination protein RAD52